VVEPARAGCVDVLEMPGLLFGVSIHNLSSDFTVSDFLERE